MGILRFDHPDILEFIAAKKHPGSLRTFNLSVAITDAFMDCVERSAEYPLINPHTGQQTGQLNARHVFDAITQSAWETGDPGLIFLDAINRRSSLPALGPTPTRAPAGAGACPECGAATEHLSGCVSCPVCGYAYCTI